MKTKFMKILLITAATLGSGLSAQSGPKSFADRLLIELFGGTLVSMQKPLSVGGGAAIGLQFRDFNLLLKPAGYVSDLTGDQKVVIAPSIRLEAKIPIARNLITLLPYGNIGGLMVKFKRIDGSMGKFNNAPMAEIGLGAEIPLTAEISLLPRIGFVYALVYEESESANYSGPQASVSLRYTFGRSTALDY